MNSEGGPKITYSQLKCHLTNGTEYSARLLLRTYFRVPVCSLYDCETVIKDGITLRLINAEFAMGKGPL